MVSGGLLPRGGRVVVGSGHLPHDSGGCGRLQLDRNLKCVEIRKRLNNRDVGVLTRKLSVDVNDNIRNRPV